MTRRRKLSPRPPRRGSADLVAPSTSSSSLPRKGGDQNSSRAHHRRNRSDSFGKGGAARQQTRAAERRRSELPGGKLRNGMATALSLDDWSARPSSGCNCDDFPDLSVNFLCMHPPLNGQGGKPCGVDGKSTDDTYDADSKPPSNRPPPPKAAAARFQEIFVDLCALHAASMEAASRHILDERFDSFLDGGEREFKNMITRMFNKGGDNGDGDRLLSDAARETSAFQRLERMLRREMGLGGLDERAERRMRRMRGLRRESEIEGEKSDTNGSNLIDQPLHVGAASSIDSRSISTSASSLASLGRGCTEESDGARSNDDSQQSIHPCAAVLREAIASIRSDDTILRRFALLRTGREEYLPSTETIAAMLPPIPLGPSLPDSTPLDALGLAQMALDRDPPPELQRECHAFQSLLQTPGHVFVANASVCDIYCDAFLCPCTIGENDRITGTIWRQWYHIMKETNPKFLKHLKVKRSEQGNRSYDCGECSKSEKNEASTDSRSAGYRNGSGSGRSRENFAPIPMQRYPAPHDRVATPLHWPWDEFRDGEADKQMCSRLARIPLLVAAEVGIERWCPLQEIQNSSDRMPKRPSRSTRAGLNDPSYALPVRDHLLGLMETVDQFVSLALSKLRREQPRPRSRRERYLLALPVVGTGGGLAGDLTGQVVEAMLRRLCHHVQSNPDVDCVLVCADVPTFSHAQNVRREMMSQWHEGGRPTTVAFDEPEAFPSFRILSPQMRDDARQLAEIAVKGQLSMFVGAGVSMGAGLPSWGDLLLGVEDQFTPNGLESERMLGGAGAGYAGAPDFLAVADWLGILASSRPDRYGRRLDLKERIAALIEERSRHPSLLMSLLTSLPCKSVVTQNYDRLVERAYDCRNVSEKRDMAKIDGVVGTGSQDQNPAEMLSVIPHDPVRVADRWLLKMHGCTSDPNSIVITSEDYRSYESGRKKALAGLVQANLMTMHLLFVGFSLSDPNYHRIIDEVRHALKPRSKSPEKKRNSGE